MTAPKKEKTFFTHFPSSLKWTTFVILILLLGYPIVYKIYQYTLNERKRVSILVRDNLLSNPTPHPESSVGKDTDTLITESEVVSSSAQPKKAAKPPLDLKPITEAMTLSFAYNTLLQKVLFGTPYQQELEFFKSVSGDILDKISLDYLEKCALTGIHPFQELEIELLLLSKKTKHPKKAVEETIPDQRPDWTDRIKRYLMSLVHIEKNDDPQQELILLRISDVFLMMQNKDLKGAITLMTDMNQRNLIESTPWVEKAQNLQGVLGELDALYNLVVKNLRGVQEKMKGGNV